MFISEIPKNRLTAEITQIAELSKKYENEYEFEYAPPAKEKDISTWEQKHDISLPEQINNRLSFTNGCTIAFDRIFGLNGFLVGQSQLPEKLVILGSTHDEPLCFSKTNGEIVRYGLREIRRYACFLNSPLIRSLKKG